MKKIVLAALLSSGLLMAADTTEDFFIKMDMNKDKRMDLIKGLQLHLKNQKVLEAYKEEIRAYEIGKYLIRAKYLTSFLRYIKLLMNKGD